MFLIKFFIFTYFWSSYHYRHVIIRANLVREWVLPRVPSQVYHQNKETSLVSCQRITVKKLSKMVSNCALSYLPLQQENNIHVHCHTVGQEQLIDRSIPIASHQMIGLFVSNKQQEVRSGHMLKELSALSLRLTPVLGQEKICCGVLKDQP